MEGFESMGLLQWVYRHLKPILVVQVIALVLAIIFSSQYFLPKE